MNQDLNITAAQDAADAAAQAALVDEYFAAMAAGTVASDAAYEAYRQYEAAGRYPTGDEVDEELGEPVIHYQRGNGRFACEPSAAVPATLHTSTGQPATCPRCLCSECRSIGGACDLHGGEPAIVSRF